MHEALHPAGVSSSCDGMRNVSVYILKIALISPVCVSLYWNSLQCGFVFDDISAIRDNRYGRTRASNQCSEYYVKFTIMEKVSTRSFSWLKVPSSAFTFKTLIRHYAKRLLTPRSLNVKLGPRRNYHKGRAAIRHYANQTARPL